jgi:transcriptional regulator with XRE-family HTH domain
MRKPKVRQKTKLFDIRIKLRLTQLELADKVGISKETVMRIENGYNNYSNRVIEKIASALSVDKNELV